MDMVKFILNMNTRFTDEEKEACIPAIDKVYQLAILAREKGILEYEPIAQTEDDITLKRALLMAVDGFDRYSMMYSLQLLILCNNFRGEKLLRSFIYTIGIDCILCCETPDFIRMKLTAMLGRKFLKKVICANDVYDEKLNTVRNFKDNLADYMPTQECDFEDLFQRMSNPCVQRVIRELSDWQIARALKGACNQKVWEIIFDNISVNRKINLISMLERLADIKPDNVLTAQNEIVELVNKLHDGGEIILSRKSAG